MRYALPLILVTCGASVLSAQEVAPVAEGTDPQSVIQTIIIGVLTLIASAVAAWIRKKVNADVAQAELDTSRSLMEQRNFIIDRRLIPFAISTAEHWFITQVPALIKDATDGNGFNWKDHWGNLVTYLKERVVQKFAAENVDIIKMLGEGELNNLLNRLAVSLISKLPEKFAGFVPKAVVDMLTKKAAEFLVDKGVDLLGVEIK